MGVQNNGKPLQGAAPFRDGWEIMTDIKSLKQLLGDGKLSRRDFLAQAAAMGMTAAAATALLGTTARAATPKQGGTLRIGLGHGSTTDSFDPATFENGFSQFTGFGFRGHLTEIDTDGKLIPDVAEGWEASDDAKAWRFKLRKGVEFHALSTK